MFSRVPPFLQSIEDPRAAQGGSLKGCPVCGGMYNVISSNMLISAESFQKVLVMVSRIVPSWRTHRGDKWHLTVVLMIAEVIRRCCTLFYAVFSENV